MSTAAQTKIFGLRLGVDPKLIVGGLLAIAAVLFWYNSRDEEEPVRTPAASVAHSQTYTAEPGTVKPHALLPRRGAASSDRGTLKLRAIDPTRGDIDPTLRLDLLARLQNVAIPANGRNVFEMGLSPQAEALLKQQIHGPTIVPKPVTPVVTPNPAMNARPVVSIPLKYYGFVKPMGTGKSNQGFFLEGDNVLVASEGEVLDQRYLVVALTPGSARLEDVRLKQGQTLSVVPEALP